MKKLIIATVILFIMLFSTTVNADDCIILNRNFTINNSPVYTITEGDISANAYIKNDSEINLNATVIMYIIKDGKLTNLKSTQDEIQSGEKKKITTPSISITDTNDTVIKMSVISDLSSITPLCSVLILNDTLNEFSDSFDCICTAQNGAITDQSESKLFTSTRNFYRESSENGGTVAVHKTDNTKQNSFIRGYGNTASLDTYIIYEGDFGSKALGVETSYSGSGNFTLKEYNTIYNLLVSVSSDGINWSKIEPDKYIFDNQVRYYFVNTANGDKICTYIYNSLPYDTKYLKIGYAGDWHKKIFNVTVTGNKSYYDNCNVISDVYSLAEGEYTFTLTDELKDTKTMWSTSGQVWTGVKETVKYPSNPNSNEQITLARRDNDSNQSEIVYALTGNRVQNIEVEAFYFNSGVALDTILEQTGLKFYQSANNRDYTEISDVFIVKEYSTSYQQIHHRVVYNIDGLNTTSRYFKIVFPTVNYNNLYAWTAKLANVDITYVSDDESERFDSYGYNASDYDEYRVSVIAPQYTSDIQGNTKVDFCAPGLDSVTARCWKQSNDELGQDSIVATVKVDRNGFGSFTFPADQYPHGPIIIRLMGIGGTHLDECHLQLYNKGGISFMEGTSSYSIPPQVQNTGLSLVFEDDFNVKPTISWNGQNTKYCSHKPSWGDFSGIPFTNDEIWNTGAPNPKSPYSQVDTYLRIRAHEEKDSNGNEIGSTGLICSVNLDSKGFKISYPCYFECKFIAQNAIGSWPAFWLLNDTSPDGDNDELDIIEAYGFDKTNIEGYSNTRIPWNYQDGSQGEIHFFPSSSIGNGGQWYTNFHTYGCLIEEDYTRYYHDNIEVWCHPTQPASKKTPFYFLFNYAFGGSSGWPYDLSRYNHVSDMYIDFVRVYGLPQNVAN